MQAVTTSTIQGTAQSPSSLDPRPPRDDNLCRAAQISMQGFAMRYAASLTPRTRRS